MKQIVQDINTLAHYLGKRDLNTLDTTLLKQNYGIEQVDVFVLFGGSILCGGDVLADAIKSKIAKKYIIVGGAGHTTDTLKNVVKKIYPNMNTKNLTEAEIFAYYLKEKYNLDVNALETKSTNCGNNITYLLELLQKEQIDFNSIILCQDATMQYRMEATLRKYVSHKLIINYASYQVHACDCDNRIEFKESINGMWDIERYIQLLMGEIPRLQDDENGYGPKGKGYLVHIDVPKEVLCAFHRLKARYNVRTANPKFATSK